jgi:cytidylate kinase
MSDRDADWLPLSDLNLFITVSGPPGCGVSTLCEALAEELDCGYASGGEVFREMAEERGESLTQLIAEAGETDEIDRTLDRRLQQIAQKWGDADKTFILESRLAGWLAGDSADLKIWLDAPEEVRVERTRDREEMGAEMRVREVIEAERYKDYYDIDLADRSIYDLSINTARWSPEATLEIVLTALRQYDAETDEGPFPAPDIEV